MMGGMAAILPASAHRSLRSGASSAILWPVHARGRRYGPAWHIPYEVYMGSLVKKRRKKMSKHKYRKRLKANRHKRKR